jgi:hypothetical protein
MTEELLTRERPGLASGEQGQVWRHHGSRDHGRTFGTAGRKSSAVSGPVDNVHRCEPNMVKNGARCGGGRWGGTGVGGAWQS